VGLGVEVHLSVGAGVDSELRGVGVEARAGVFGARAGGGE
jgi:hypothetical protein